MPIECSCPACDKQFRVKDELAGKKFKCTACGAVVSAGPPAASPPAPAAPAAPAARKPTAAKKPTAADPARKPASAAARRKRAAAADATASTGSTSKARPTKKKRPAKKKVKKKPDPFGDEYRDADPDDLFADDFGDDYGEPIDDYDDYGDDSFDDDPYNTPPRKKRKKAAAKSGTKRKKKKSSGGGWNIGFNINRINIALLFGGGILIFLGISEARLSAKSNSTPVSISLSEVLQNRPESIYLTVTEVVSSDEYIYEESGSGRLQKIWAPAHPPGSPNANFILYSTKPRTQAEASALIDSRSFTGMITNDIRSLGSEERNLLRTIPGVNPDTAIIFEIGRKPSGFLAVLLYFVGGLAVMAGGAAWIFLTGSD
ncbi:MAG: hypothetical protein Fues2KO_17670 [Fuerstiella sp.]